MMVSPSVKIKVEDIDECHGDSQFANVNGNGNNNGCETPRSRNTKTETETATSHEKQKKMPTFDEDNLQLLSSKIASRVCKYPPGCPVWYDITKSSPKLLDANYGIIKSVYIDVESGARIYKVKKNHHNGHHNNNNNAVVEDKSEEQFVLEENLRFAMNCPVRVKGMVDNEPQKELDGRIVCPKGNGKSYGVRFFLKEGKHHRVRVALGVDSDQITFRKIDSKHSVEERLSPMMMKDDHEMNQNDETNLSLLRGSKKEEEDRGLNTVKEQPCTETTNQNIELTKSFTPERISSKCNAIESQNIPRSEPTARSVNPLLSHSKKHKTHFMSDDTRPHKTKRSNDYSTTKTTLPQVYLHEQFERATNAQQQQPQIEQKSLPSIQKSHPSTSADNAAKALLGQTSLEESATSPSSKQQIAKNRTILCNLTVPLWVTDSTDKNLFDHITGLDDGSLAYKTHNIEHTTGCYVKIHNELPVKITIKPKYGHEQDGEFDVERATNMVQDLLLDFLEDDEGAWARLLYELGLHREVAVASSVGDGETAPSYLQHTGSGVVHQRIYGTNHMAWMKLFDIPSGSLQLGAEDLHSLQEELQQNLSSSVAECSAKVFSQSLNNIKLPVVLCKPFVLVYGTHRQDVSGKASGIVADVVNKYRRRIQSIEREGFNTTSIQNNEVPPPIPPAVSSPGKRKSAIVDDSSLSSHSYSQGSSITAERPTKASKGGNNQKDKLEVTCILTVPLWLMKKCNQDNELFFHLLGHRGQKLRMIRHQTSCSVNLSDYNSKDGTPMLITIATPNMESYSFHDIIPAKRMIMQSLLEFMGDADSEGRLLYDLAMSVKGTFIFRKSDGAVRQECQHSGRLVWMKVVELPSAEHTPHGKYLLGKRVQTELTDGTGCYIEVYEYPALCPPYVLVCGNNPGEVNGVAAKVTARVDEHQRCCPQDCTFSN